MHVLNSHSCPRAALLHFYISHRSDSNSEGGGEGGLDERRGRERVRHLPGQAQPPTDIFSHVGLYLERNGCTQSTHRLHGLTVRENNTDKGEESLEGVVRSRACTP